MLKILHQKNHNPYFNIATEEYLLKHKTDNFFIIYRNNPSIIIGKHQNASAEINHQFVEEKQIAVVRRLSGGGTVYHDLGNINFCFIMNGEEGKLVDFRRFTEPIVEILQGFGVNAYLGEKNDIRVGDKKISGNAEHVYHSRVLHHGTLLFQSDLDVLNQAIKVEPNKYADNAVKSNRSVVANIAEFLPSIMQVDFFEEIIIGYMLNFFPQSKDFFLSEEDNRAIHDLIESKYSTWEWNYGYSPSYELINVVETSEGSMQIKVRVSKGLIEEIVFSNVIISNPELEKLKSKLIGIKHSKEEVGCAINDKQIGDFFQNHLSVKLIPEYFC